MKIKYDQGTIRGTVPSFLYVQALFSSHFNKETFSFLLMGGGEEHGPGVPQSWWGHVWLQTS